MTVTLTSLTLTVAVLAIIFTAIVVFTKKHKSILISYLQSFTGILFIISGFVKAVDPLGTAYKLDQYFAEFIKVFKDTWLSGLVDTFPVLMEYSVGLSVFMIVFEILLGVMLLMGSVPKLTAWLFFLLVLFFTFLTGFTYLTGYVPPDGKFFDFSTWGAYKATNMKVTDCGCFGDFLKLEPKTSFFKDVFLLIPALVFIFRSKKMHVLLTTGSRLWINISVTLGFTYFCLSNYVWKEPVFDFRPFKIGTDVAAQYKKEKDAQGKVRVLRRVLQNTATGETVDLAESEYMTKYTQYGEGWTTIDQIRSEPEVPKSKISDFMIKSYDGNDMTDLYLENDKNHIMIISHKIKFNSEVYKETVQDTIMKTDTVYTKTDTSLVTSIDTIISKTVDRTKINLENPYLEDYLGLKEFIGKAANDGVMVSIVLGGASKLVANELKKQIGVDQVKIFEADDILLKTIIRSNPGILLWKNGKIIHKWHKNKLPDYDEVKKDYIK